MAAPLTGVRVVELGQVLAGPFAGAILAELGAEVLKVERAEGGDDARRMGLAFRHGDSLAFHIFNRGKQSVALDLRSADGRAALDRLLADAPLRERLGQNACDWVRQHGSLDTLYTSVRTFYETAQRR